MKKREFLTQFSLLLPDKLSETSIEPDDIECTTLLFIGETISRMTIEAQSFYDQCDQESGIFDSFDEWLLKIVAKKYKIEW